MFNCLLAKNQTVKIFCSSALPPAVTQMSVLTIFDPEMTRQHMNQKN